MVGYKTDRKHVPHSRGLRKADLMVKDFQLAGIRDLIIDVSMRHEFHGSCQNHMRNGEASHADANGVISHVDAREQTDKAPEPFDGVCTRQNALFRPAVLLKSEGICAEHAAMLSKDTLLQPGEFREYASADGGCILAKTLWQDWIASLLGRCMCACVHVC